MPSFARSSPGTTHHNTLILPRVKVFFQRFPGTLGSDADRGIANVPFVFKVDGRLVGKGTTAADGSVTVFTLPAVGLAVLNIFGTDYNLIRVPLEPAPDIAGAQRRLQLLGYMSASVTNTLEINAGEALFQFQADNPPLDPQGDLPDPTTTKLKSVFGE